MTKEYAFLFSVSLYHRISFLEATAARELITQPPREHYEVAPQAVEKILQTTSGHPYYTQLVCHCLFDSWSRSPRPVLDVADVEAVLAEVIELGSANLTYVWRDATVAEQALMAGMAAAMRHQDVPVTLDQVRAIWKTLNVSLPERESIQALQGLLQREVAEGGGPAYSFAVDLQRLWIEKHRHLDWVKEELAETAERWNRSAQEWPADTIAMQAGKHGRIADHDAMERKPAESPIAAKLQLFRRGPYMAIAVCIVLLFGYLAASAVAGVFPFSHSGSTTGPTQLMQLLTRVLYQNADECHSTQAPRQWSMPGLTQALQCTDPRLTGGSIYAYQLSSDANFQAAWRSFNQWWQFISASAGKTCPPPQGTAQGVVSSINIGLDHVDRQVWECAVMVLGPNKRVPAYAWDFPDIGAFLIAEGAAGSSFSALAAWQNLAAPGPSSAPSQSVAGGSTPSASRSQATSLASLLEVSTQDRASVVTAVDDIYNCGSRLAGDAQTLQNAAKSRGEELPLLHGFSALPSNLVTELASAWRNSLEADQDLAAWAQDEIAKGCVRDNTADPKYRAAFGPDTQATADKQAFARLWNPIAVQYGLPTYQWNQL
jgi:hypothetical protein